MNPQDLASSKKRLLALQAEILAEGDVAIEPLRKDPVQVGTDDDEQPLAEMNQVIAAKRNQARADVLARVVLALERLETGADRFGLCQECDEPIGKRLQLLPYVELCVDCQQSRDGTRNTTSRRHLTDFR